MTECRDQHGIESDYGIEHDVGGRVENRTDTEIHKPIAQLLQSLLAGNVVQRESNTSMLCRKLLHGARQHVVDRRLAGGDREPPLFDVTAPRFKILVERSESIHEGARQFVKEFTLR